MVVCKYLSRDSSRILGTIAAKVPSHLVNAACKGALTATLKW
jgi:hypothetical protein